MVPKLSMALTPLKWSSVYLQTLITSWICLWAALQNFATTEYFTRKKAKICKRSEKFNRNLNVIASFLSHWPLRCILWPVGGVPIPRFVTIALYCVPVTESGRELLRSYSLSDKSKCGSDRFKTWLPYYITQHGRPQGHLKVYVTLSICMIY